MAAAFFMLPALPQQTTLPVIALCICDIKKNDYIQGTIQPGSLSFVPEFAACQDNGTPVSVPHCLLLML
jgi:hypothetical protein